jgi:enoyl-CoA hydratase
MYETIEFETAGGVATLRLHRPDRLNAINLQMIEEVGEVVGTVEADPGLRAMILTGSGRAFCAGADISVLDQLDGPGAGFRFIETVQRAGNALEDLRVPTIAAINGVAFGGGCELSLCCDLRIMAADAAIGVPEIKLGLLPGMGGTQRLSRLVPPAVAKQMLYFGEPLSAEEAARHGLVNKVVAGADLLAEAGAWAGKLCELPPLALRSTKLLVHGAALDGLANGIESERQALAYLFGTRDSREGIRAFLEKRPARFTGE